MQSSSQIITTNKPTSSFFYRPNALPVAKPTVSKHWRAKISHFMDLLTPSSPGVFQLCLWPLVAPGYLWGRVAMPLISPLMPVPHVNALLMGYILFSTFHVRTNRYHSSFGVGLTDLFFTATSSHVLRKKISINEVVEMEFPSLRSLDQQHQVTVRIKWNMNRTWRCAQTHIGSLSDSDLVKCWAATPQHRTWVAWPTTGFLQFR